MAQQMSDPSELFPLLESNDLHVIQEIKALIQDNLNSARDPGFLNALVDFYILTNSQNALDLLAGVREPLDKPLMDRMNDNMKAGHKMQSLTLLSHVVRRQPSWLHKIVQAPLFMSLLNCLKMDVDVPVIMCGLLSITTLLPMIPSLVGPSLPEIFRVFSHLASWNVRKPGGIPDVYQLHLQVAVYALFHRLYGMYPLNFLQHLRSYYQNKNEEFKKAVLPMMERVRMHPLLVIGTARSETENARWRKMEVHDVLMECARVSLDTTESARDDSFNYVPIPVGFDPERRGSKGIAAGIMGQGMRTSSPIVDGHGTELSHKPLIQWDSDAKKADPDTHSLVSSQEGGIISMFSPSMVCGLSTPPSSHPPSPLGSQLDVSLTSSVQMHYTTPLQETPTPQSTPHDSPHPNAALHLSSRMSSMSEGSVHSRAGKGSGGRAGRGKLPPITTHSAMSLSRTVSAPVTPGYESKSLPCTPQKPLMGGKASSQEITKQRRFVWDDAEALATNGTSSSSTKEPPQAAPVTEESEARKERTESSVSLRDLPEVIKDLSHEEQRPRDDDAMNEEVSSFIGSPYTPQDLETSVNSCITTTQTKTTTSDRLPLKTDMATPSMTMSSAYLMKVHSKDAETTPRANGTSRQETVRTQSDPSAAHRSTLIKSSESETRLRTSSFGNKATKNISADLFGVRKGKDASVEHTITPQGFVPIIDQSIDSLESPITRYGTQSTTSDTFSTPGPSYNQQAPPQMPYMHLFNLIVPTLQNLSPAGTSSRDHSPVVSSANSTGSGLYSTPPPMSRVDSLPVGSTPIDSIGKVPLHSLYSPSQLLDRHLQMGNMTHEDQLTGLSLVSQGAVDWTHFGGSPPADEIKLLKGQLQLLHNQLLYERHKREVHAERNRRLLGKTHKAKALEESNAAMLEQRQLLEVEVNQVRAAFKLLREENKQLSEANSTKDQTHNALMKKLQGENEHMRDANEELQKLLVHHKQEVDKEAKELQAANAKLFTVQQELDNARADVAANRHLKDEIARLNRELLLMGETNTKYQEKVEEARRNDHKTEETEMRWTTLKKDLAVSQESLKRKNVQTEAAKARIGEMEASLTLKDVAMAEQKRFLENVKSLNKGKMESMDAKYNALKKINQCLEAHILKLTKSLREREKETGHFKRRHHVAPQGISRRHSGPSSGAADQKMERMESSDSGGTSSSGMYSIQTSSPRTLDRSQSQDETYPVRPVDVDAHLVVKTESNFSQTSLSVKGSKDDHLTPSHLSGSHSTPRSSPMSEWENLSGEVDLNKPTKKEPAEAILVPKPTERAGFERHDSGSRLHINSPPLVFSDTSPFQRVQQSPRLSTRHSSFSPSSKISLNPSVEISRRAASQSCPDLDSSGSQFTNLTQSQVEGGEEDIQEEEVSEGTSTSPPGAVVDSVEPRVFHHGLASILHMEASIEEADLSKYK
ncbi:hamartin-like [Asterias amurensis]|uniref:hamartin-like n=1 Tax=Asterias amurensis TaxID=7602 RepID=UPI003AB3A5D1